MSRVTAVLLALAVALPVTAYVASVAGSDPPVPADHSPVILRDADPADPAGLTDREERGEAPARQQDDRREDADPARVVTPQPTPVGEDDDDDRDDDERDDDEWDDGPGDDDTETDDGDD
ncbi:hypothetical protein Q9S36_42845 [Microbacterium sp. ARD31]|uniref:hypothetical protein n=1 Tax=Microbacterium sp. ARD31 TaxID=2962576 RepID=UPI0028815CA0|nr:hypothetical protein [Microbacterium sp. ARD31]MDT0186943.1 hypothetical protein [Microbacterium sp. ARD31]